MKLISLLAFLGTSLLGFSQIDYNDSLCHSVIRTRQLQDVIRAIEKGADVNCYCDLTHTQSRSKLIIELTGVDSTRTRYIGTPLEILGRSMMYAGGNYHEERISIASYLVEKGADPLLKFGKISALKMAFSMNDAELVATLNPDNPFPDHIQDFIIGDLDFAIALIEFKMIKPENLNLRLWYTRNISSEEFRNLLNLGYPTSKITLSQYRQWPDLAITHPTTKEAFSNMIIPWEWFVNKDSLLTIFIDHGYQVGQLSNVNVDELFNSKEGLITFMEGGLSPSAKFKVYSGTVFVESKSYSVFSYSIHKWGPDVDFILKCADLGADLLTEIEFSDSTEFYGITWYYDLFIYALETNVKPLIDLLLNAGYDVNKVGKLHGWTPIYYAIRSSNFENVKLLVKEGADLTVIDVVNKTPYKFCKKRKNTLRDARILPYLKEQTKIQLAK